MSRHRGVTVELHYPTWLLGSLLSSIPGGLIVVFLSTAAWVTLVFVDGIISHQDSFEELARELTALSVLVFLFEFLHAKAADSKNEDHQKRTIRELLFLIDTTKTTSLEKDNVSDFGYAVDETINFLDKFIKTRTRESFEVILEHVREIGPHVRLAPLSNEVLFINLTETCGGVQALITENQGRESEFHQALLRIYREMQMLLFLSERYRAVRENRIELIDEGQRCRNELNVLMGVTYCLDRLHKARAGLNLPDDLFLEHEVSHSVSARLVHAVLNCAVRLSVQENELYSKLCTSMNQKDLKSNLPENRNDSEAPILDRRMQFCEHLINGLKRAHHRKISKIRKAS